MKKEFQFFGKFGTYIRHEIDKEYNPILHYMEYTTDHKVYYYYDSSDCPIKITAKTCELTPYTFLNTGKLWEDKSLEQFFNLMPKEKPIGVIDVGAQTGLYSLYAKYLPNATFFAFEPFEPSFRELNENLKLNGITNVHTFKLAISDKLGVSNFNVCKSHNGLHTLGTRVARFNDIQVTQVQTTTLDTLFGDSKTPIHFIKIDTEGHEYYVLKGGMKVIEKWSPLIQIEVNPINLAQNALTINNLKGLVDSMGYEIKYKTSEEFIIGRKEWKPR